MFVAAACLTVLGLAACSTQDAVTIALSGDPEEAAKNLVISKRESYKRNPVRLIQDAKTVRQQFAKLAALLSQNVGIRWGKREILLPSRTRYVKYTQNYQSRAVVDFDAGTVVVETVDQQAPETSLKNAIVTTLLTPDDPRAVDLYSDKTIRLSGTPYLYGLVLDQRNHPVGNPAQAEGFADFLLSHHHNTRPLSDGGKTVHYVSLGMVPNRVDIQAQRYEPLVARYSHAYGVSKSLVYAVMKTESNFNPFAVSAAPAYGLMQLVPTSGGRDAYRYVNGVDGVPSPDYLFDPANNIELGTAYLDLVNEKYLGKIHDPVSREYCTIAAYNGGAGAALMVFDKDRDKAVRIINRLHPADVYQKLTAEHPREETRRYLVKVLDARRDFANI